MTDTVRYDNGRRVTNQTFSDAVERGMESGFITLSDPNDRETKTSSRGTFVVGAPGDSV